MRRPTTQAPVSISFSFADRFGQPNAAWVWNDGSNFAQDSPGPRKSHGSLKWQQRWAMGALPVTIARNAKWLLIGHSRGRAWGGLPCGSRRGDEIKGITGSERLVESLQTCAASCVWRQGKWTKVLRQLANSYSSKSLCTVCVWRVSPSPIWGRSSNQRPWIGLMEKSVFTCVS